MTTRSLLFPILCSALLTFAACDKEESLGEIESETAAESDASQSASAGTETGGDSDSGVNCSAEAMICPDGSAVGRSGPDCAFDPCPGGSDSDTDDDVMPLCAPDDEYVEPAGCPLEEANPYVIDPGCHTPCLIESPECGDDRICMAVQINPCVCDQSEGEGCCDACGGAAMLCVPVLSGDACDMAVGTYLSLEEYECGLSPDGVEMCQWSVSLEFSGEYVWMYSDIGEGGNFACKDGVITLDNAPSHEASLDPETGILTWDGIQYGPVEF